MLCPYDFKGTPEKEVQEKLLPGELGVSPSFFHFPQEWGIQGVD